MNLKGRGSFPNSFGATLPFLQANRQKYLDVTKTFVVGCPSLEVVTWGFEKGSKRWWHIPIKSEDRTGGGAIAVNVDDEIRLSDNAVYDESEFEMHSLSDIISEVVRCNLLFSHLRHN